MTDPSIEKPVAELESGTRVSTPGRPATVRYESEGRVLVFMDQEDPMDPEKGVFWRKDVRPLNQE